LQDLLRKKYGDQKVSKLLCILMMDNDELCKAVVNQVKCDLINSGVVPKVEKSLWKPTKQLIWLGTLSIVKQDFIEFLIRGLTRL
jgi:hypothetical protein